MFVKSYYAPGVELFWFWAITTGNFPSLKNLAKQIRYFGPLRWYWEGTRERYIQQVKDVLVSMRKTVSYFEKKLVLLHTMNTITWLRKGLDVRQTQSTNSGFYRYPNGASVQRQRAFRSGRAVLSGVMIKVVAGVILISTVRKRYGHEGFLPLTYRGLFPRWIGFLRKRYTFFAQKNINKNARYKDHF